MLKTLNLTVALLALSLSSIAFAECNIQSLDIKAPAQVEFIQKIGVKQLIDQTQSYLINSVDIDGDGQCNYLIIMNDKNSCLDHGCSFLGIKETAESHSVIRTGYVSIKDGKAQWNANNKIVFNTTASK
jgi:hypothetical protein